MAQHNDFGKEAETRACQFLQQKCYTIVTRNFRFQHAEIDIIAKKDDLLIIVEVKARSSDTFGAPELFVDNKKIRLLIEAANHFCETTLWHGEVRFDIISILKISQQFHINHIEDAFTPHF